MVGSDESNACLLPDGREAYTVRAACVRGARRSVDVQSYIWRSDTTGRLLADELLQAADRGVRVRVLLDDMDARSRDPVLVALNRHPRIAIRLFNPFATRSGTLRTLRELFVRRSRLNHRMHNKSWIVDGRFAIVGGRNVGDEYFAASEEMNFIDMDVLLTGAAVAATARAFDAYWNSAAAVPVFRLRRVGRNKYTLGQLRQLLREASREAAESSYGRYLSAAPSLEELLHDRRRWSGPGEARIVVDDPRKAQRHPRNLAPGVLESLIDALSAARSEVLLVSPYFVPGPGGTAALRDLARRGVEVAVLTNSLAATDVAAVHSGYARYRCSLLEGGVRLHELKAAPVALHEQDRRMGLGSSRASLHTKAAIIDRKRLFVGSFNLDPRSAELNCEMGVWITNEALAAEMRTLFAASVKPEHSYRLSLENDRLYWTGRAEGRELRYDREPQASWARRAITWLLHFLPIESQL